MHLPPAFLRRAVPYNSGGEAHRWGLGISVGKKGSHGLDHGRAAPSDESRQAKRGLASGHTCLRVAQTLPRPSE
jgi:hypothetical protein